MEMKRLSLNSDGAFRTTIHSRMPHTSTIISTIFRINYKADAYIKTGAQGGTGTDTQSRAFYYNGLSLFHLPALRVLYIKSPEEEIFSP